MARSRVDHVNLTGLGVDTNSQEKTDEDGKKSRGPRVNRCRINNISDPGRDKGTNLYGDEYKCQYRGPCVDWSRRHRRVPVGV